MRRRTLLRVAGVSLAGALAGCSDSDIDDSKRTPPDTATGTTTADEPADLERNIRALWTAYNDESPEGVVETFHPESPHGISAENLTFGGTVTIDTLTVTDRNDDEAVVDATVTVTDDNQSITESHTYALRRYEGAWLIWDFEISTADETETTVSPTATADGP